MFNTSDNEKIINFLSSSGETIHDFTPSNERICRLISSHIEHFFDFIYIPIDYFSTENWKIKEVLYDNKDALFYDQKYLSYDQFHEIFDKYISMLENIFSSSGKLIFYIEQLNYLANANLLKRLIVHKKYRYISPSYIANIYDASIRKEKYWDVEKKLSEHLDGIYSTAKKEMVQFKKHFLSIIMYHVYWFPFRTNKLLEIVIKFILNFTEKMLGLNIYAIHPIVNNVVEFYLPLEEIIEYDLENNDGRELVIV